MFALRLALVAGLLSACGDDAHPPDAAPPADASPGPDAPPLMGTLTVVGSFLVENPANGTSGTNLRVNCELSVTRDGEPVGDAIVMVNPAPPAFQTVLVGDALDPSYYTGSYMGYFETARLTVRVGNRETTGEILLVGPKLGPIEQPQANQVVPANAPLHVSWSQPGGAVDTADVALESGWSVMELPDPGVYDIPAAEIDGDPMMDQVIVTRWRVNNLPGAAPDSSLRFGVRARQTFYVQ